MHDNVQRDLNQAVSGRIQAVQNDQKFNPALFARLAAGDGFAPIQGCRAYSPGTGVVWRDVGEA